MSRTLKVGRLGAKYCWRIGSHYPHAGHVESSVRGLQKRHYAGRFTFDDLTQARIDAANRQQKPVDPIENPWRYENTWTPDFPKRLDELGYDSHCNDRLYIAKNKMLHNQQEYERERQERRIEAQQRVQEHFDGQARPAESRRRFIMQDPAEHQKRQQQIIEFNRRRWQSRPEAKRETNTSGITYRPDIQKQWKEMLEANKRLAEERGSPDSNPQGRVGRESPDFGLQSRQMGYPTTGPDAEDESRRGRGQREDAWRVKSRRADAEEELWRERNPRADAEEDVWRVRNEREEAWRSRSRSQDTRLQERLSMLMERAEAEANEEAGEDRPRAEAEADEEDSRGRRPRGGAEEDARRARGEREDARGVRGEREDALRARAEREDARRAKFEREDARGVRGERENVWRVKSRRAEAEDEQWRERNPREDAEEDARRPRGEREDVWRVRGEREDVWRVRRESSDSGLQTSRLKSLMEMSEAEESQDADEDAWRAQNPKAEVEESPKREAEDKSGRNLSLVYDPNRPSEAWMKKQQDEEESQYWHSWHTCPANREAETDVELKPHNRRKKVLPATRSYTRGGQRRGYHHLVPPTTRLKARTLMMLRRRRFNGIEQHYHKLAQPEPLPHAEQMPQPLQLVPEKETKAKPKRKGERKPVQPPRFKMTIKTRPVVKRRPAPVASYSRRLNIPPEVAGPSFYMANLRSSVTESWRSFTGNYTQ